MEICRERTGERVREKHDMTEQVEMNEADNKRMCSLNIH